MVDGEKARLLFRTDLPESLAVLAELALDLRWTWSHAGDALWRTVNPERWERTRNPWTLLQDVTSRRSGSSSSPGIRTSGKSFAS